MRQAIRKLTLVGKVYRNTKTIRLAVRCAWCRAWASHDDYIAAHQDGARVTHSICESCAAKWDAADEALDPKVIPFPSRFDSRGGAA
jgi:hypothetical protein